MKNNKSIFFIFTMFSLIVLSLFFVSALQPVNLGTAGDFVILSKSGISTTGTTLITGNIGVSPIDHTALTGFSETIHSSNEYSTSDYVVGKMYASNYLGEIPTKMTIAISDMETAYTDAAGRTNPTATELGAGDVSGMTIAPGLYKWGTGLMIDSSGVTLSGGASDVWIFQISEDLTVAEGAIITLSGGAQAKNIFWQVTGQTTLGTTSNFKGNILCATAIVFNTGATLNGRVLSQTAVTLDANTIVLPKTDSTPISSPTTETTNLENENSAGTSNPVDNGGSNSGSDSENTATSTGSNEIKLDSSDVKLETELSIEGEGNNIRATQSNGLESEIKIMPDAASDIALNRLRLKVCSEENNCTIELKEVGKGEQTQIVYELKLQRESKILGLFKKQMEVSAQVNANNGEIISIKKPWWSFLASEKDERKGSN